MAIFLWNQSQTKYLFACDQLGIHSVSLENDWAYFSNVSETKQSYVPTYEHRCYNFHKNTKIHDSN